MFPPSSGAFEEDWMFDELLDIEELCTADSVGEANRLLQEGWELLGFHPAPPAQSPSVIGSPTTIFVLARLYDYEDEEDAELDLEELERLEPLTS